MRRILFLALLALPLGAGPGRERALEHGDHWLTRHQDPGGKWDADGFTKHCPDGVECTGVGTAAHDVGATALALLAFLGDGSTMREGAHADEVARGIQWLQSRQGASTGLVGEASDPHRLRNHAIATVAMCEACYLGGPPEVRESARRAIDYLAGMRSLEGGWRGETTDPSVDGWAILALASAREAGLRVEDAALAHALAWIDGLEDGGDGLAAAMGLLGGFLLGRDPAEHPAMVAQADRLLAVLPTPDEPATARDPELLYFGSYAMYQMGGRHWKRWNAALKSLVLETQRRDGALEGSWDPVGPSATVEGRVWSTSLMTLCLEVYFRYARVIGGR